ncbi:MAG: imidazolonepropionase, partial [Deltaproteobacteria bacterium]|nr:imidazolonepropionase [Deltaproteobacteria bacterium]
MDAKLLLGRLVSLADSGAIDDGAVVVDGGRVAWVGPRSELPERFAPLGAAALRAPLVTPGLVDAHTHAAWVGSRHGEYVAKLRGEGYEAIAARGGGIVASMRAIEEADAETIAATLVERLRRMARMGVTSVEVKSGYGLRPELERRQLAAIATASRASGVPRVVPTFLALHALPPESRGDEGKRADFVASAARLVREVAARKEARFVDAYVDRNAFRVDEARAVMRVAREVGLGVRMHVGQFADVGGAELCAELGARSADHLENVGAEGLAAMAAAGVRAVLLPVASFVLGQTPPDVAALRRAGVRLVVASDANPGTAPTESLPLAMSFAARLYGMSTEEILAGATREAARSLELGSG